MSPLPDVRSHLIDRRTGELLDLAIVDTARLARFVDDLTELRGEFDDAEALANAELVARMDRDVTWTIRVQDVETGHFYTLTAPSPDAGSVTYAADVLERELRALVQRGTLSAAGAGEALRRRLTVEVDVPLDADLEALEHAVGTSVETKLGGVLVDVVNVTATRRAMLGGVKKIAKVSGTGAAIGRAKRFTPTATRRAKVRLEPRS